MDEEDPQRSPASQQPVRSSTPTDTPSKDAAESHAATKATDARQADLTKPPPPSAHSIIDTTFTDVRPDDSIMDSFHEQAHDAGALPALEPLDTTTTDVSNTTSSLENLDSSPTAAAAARTISRVISSASAHSQGSVIRNPGAGDDSFSANDNDDELPSGLDFSRSALSSRSLGLPSGVLPKQRRSPSPTKQAFDAGSTPGHALQQKPKYLRSRNSSQRSSTSSFTNPDADDGDSDVTVGLAPDYGMHMGSMASGIEDLHESGAASSKGYDHLETLDEDASFRIGDNPQDDLLRTPKPSKQNLKDPTDTVIARHVQNVQVPESLAKEYKFRSGLVTPRKPSNLTSSIGPSRSGKNLTLKEQSSTIERLSKENFDLKLKVMFLSDRLDKLSEEGVKEMISENVELKTSLAVIQRENKALRRRVKDLEKQLKEEDERPSTAKSGASSNSNQSFEDAAAAQEREEELFYLRERIEEYSVEVERLRHECMNRENEKRKMSEMVRTLGERSAGESLGRQDETDMWKDLLEQETARREQSDEDNRRLRDEIFRMKQEMAAAGGSLHHTTNIYNITKKNHNRAGSPSRPVSGLSGDMESTNGMSTASTLIEELRRESEQLRHENAELRREVGAQTSMLTSRNREKERLYQEIEDLKMAQRRGGPAPSTIDTLLERSASRAGAHHHPQHQRSMSRNSGTTRVTNPQDEAEREELENQLAECRDKINEVKLQNQELEQELDKCMQDFEVAIDGKRQAEELATALQQDLDTTMNDLVALQAERDEALREQAEMEAEFEALRKEAQTEIDALEADLDQRAEDSHRLQLDLQDRSENFAALQEEMRKMSDALLRLEDEQENKLRRIQELEHELIHANAELEDLENKLAEANDKANRLGVQQESSQGEVAFLREEQEADKIRIGNLEAELAASEQSLRDERDRATELEQRLQAERRQREMVANREKEEVQQLINGLNRETSAARDESRRLRKALTSREVEAAEWKERLMELEGNLRVALGDLNGTRSSLLNSISGLQRQLEDTVRELDAAKGDIGEKDRALKQRDGLLESHGLESRRLAELLEKERQGHRTTKSQFETFQKTHHHVSVTANAQEERIHELEIQRAQTQKRLASLESTFKEQLTERNNLLLSLWARLSGLCGSDWAHDNSLINGRALPSLEAVATMLPGFSKNLLAAVKTLEDMVKGFRTRIKGVERELWREYQSLENGLEVRIKKLDKLETMVRNGIASGSLSRFGASMVAAASSSDAQTQARADALEDVVRQLRVENATLRTASDSLAFDTDGSARQGQQPDEEKHLHERGRHNDDDADVDHDASVDVARRSAAAPRPGSSASREVVPSAAGDTTGGNGSGSGDNALMLRLRDMERRLRTEREGRNQDRTAARQRLGDLENQNRELKSEVGRMKRMSEVD
ncbi:unnamed protein product [Parascedosporium putredinis]|uniref:Anucleate primary sterigmata protein B n=1 Tax=Parascedosporium putredinis TaxID=1442378 RepID=A0A9P1MCC4_9PEZI|nr:unnamed protein product [Parascedosporium putredinis]CAI7996279.1 unnamed protein product [Parascedosporium putredinis]